MSDGHPLNNYHQGYFDDMNEYQFADDGFRGYGNFGKRRRVDPYPEPAAMFDNRRQGFVYTGNLKDLLDEQMKMVPLQSMLPNCAFLLQREIEFLRNQEMAPPVMREDPGAMRPSRGPFMLEETRSNRGMTPEQSYQNIYTGMQGKDQRSSDWKPSSSDGIDTVLVDHLEKSDGNCKTMIKIFVPVDRYPGFNFVGRLLGPRGSTFVELQASSGCKMTIRGRGSIKLKPGQTEASLMRQANYQHLSEPLDLTPCLRLYSVTQHVVVEYEGPSWAKDRTLRHAENILKEVMIPPSSEGSDKIKQQQLRDLAILNGKYRSPPRKPRVDDNIPGRGFSPPDPYGGYAQPLPGGSFDARQPYPGEGAPPGLYDTAEGSRKYASAYNPY
ncbi:hypothetical protein GUITHDRAFT_165235 [Guillardia theta CCMP2712]|uniref:KHDC4/BBP-like KH-domain type I domain-containing protein n=1 Tax=Guillardia theta (strain CCMP2712) TaxID=905079 RepID=L1IRB8_GUITC|nr:hypothetical protein GUITHDRAFT_165235 [Guillardia theta CCMP2712]EKX38370.1 hypothetical protein GUITHDRAFT_165235 [Guillardia theta CCMP2712]|eukprot:XP_005825350.1 hypothetical protein GUITHDRAFT_165235 [Guillardia theta CCMP2712]